MVGIGGFHGTSIQLFQITSDKETSFIWIVNSDMIMYIRILVFLYSYPIYHTDVLSLKWEFITCFLGEMVVLTNFYVPSFHSGHTTRQHLESFLQLDGAVVCGWKWGWGSYLGWPLKPLHNPAYFFILSLLAGCRAYHRGPGAQDEFGTTEWIEPGSLNGCLKLTSYIQAHSHTQTSLKSQCMVMLGRHESLLWEVAEIWGLFVTAVSSS